ncbi:HVO_A0556 family zinc finger protein [Natronobacterium gregoryi]|uniref:Small CPxCG-related zinc finger protein n=2 Tax=Natronobacterium gregoryi TaxID=44930 RepID=L0AGH5_NATGS|nr:HVO_A0556 family zinc finger protein [Natronobacterium gregoryi]AFZ72257.1 hypothetical protein Natgr_1026 [Natronobacterium gregoryi SP2]PLK20204.1 hypothetical protein CYV19_10955 [Natronobacterium gregoryi SP2]SFJ29051.1 hypothetical protein SAMN05443661_12055 [Natronobacterium gregoryi]
MAKSDPARGSGTDGRSPTGDKRRLLSALEGRSCPTCDDGGTLERATYKGNAAVICDACGTPRVQVWTASF